MKTATTRENWIDIGKGIAMLLIIIGHVSADMQGWWNFRWVYGIHVVMFFLLSGYTFKKTRLDRTFLNKKFTRLMVPYFVTCLAIICMDIFNSGYISQDCSVVNVAHIIGRDLVRSFFASGSIQSFGSIEIGSRIGAIWFLPAMFFAVLITQLVLQKEQRVLRQGLILGGIALLAVITKDFIWLPFSIQSGMVGAFFLWIGYTCKTHSVFSKLRWYHYAVALIVYVLGALKGYSVAHIVGAYFPDEILSVITGLSGCLVVALISRKIERERLLAYIGRISLTVLCVHTFALETMGHYFVIPMNRMGLTGNLRVWALIFIEVLFAVIVAAALHGLKRLYLKARTAITEKDARSDAVPVTGKRDVSVDIARGILIIAMLIGHLPIDGVFRSVIYSCHMIAFIFLSGYFYKKSDHPGKAVLHMVRTFLLPYAVFVGVFLLLNHSSWSPAFFRDTLIQYGLGISFTSRVLTSIPSVGPVYFILLLFLSRLIYLILDHFCRSEKWMTAIALIVSLFGVVLGHKGFWLPWSIDIALYGVIFYHLGVLFRRYRLLEKVFSINILYFILSPIWAYMIYKGSMEIAMRNYGQYGLVIFGALAGVLIVCQLSGFISRNLPVVSGILKLAGEYSLYILIIHVLLRNIVSSFVARCLTPDYFPHAAVCLIINVAIGILIGMIISGIKKKHGKLELRHV